MISPTRYERGSREGRLAMYNDNAFKIGLFGANCSSGRAVTTVPERWSGAWDDMVKLARTAEEAGIDFLLPIGRWKGYGGVTDYQGSTYETITWAASLLAITERITVFGTVHAPLFSPIIAAKQMVTADHVGHGRFGLNIVCGWNEGEFDMFGADPKTHAARYAQGQEWIDAITRMWEENDFDFHGEYFDLRGVRLKPKPSGGTRPLMMNAGQSPEGRAFAIRNTDALFVTVKLADGDEASFQENVAYVAEAKAQARALGRSLDVFTVGVVTCRPTRKEAQEYERYVLDNADWGTIDNIMEMKGLNDRPPEVRERIRSNYARGMGGLPIVGDPDDVASYFATMHDAGYRGIGISMVNYLDELPYFRDEVLPRLERRGIRVKA